MKHFTLRRHYVLTILAFTLSHFLTINSNAQCGGSTHPLNQPNMCKSTNESGFVNSWNAAIQQYNTDHNGQAGWKQKSRSVFLSQKLNGVGDAINAERFTDDLGNVTYYFDPNIFGSVLGIDEDNNCIYEREDALLQQLADLEFDEIILYAVSGLLEKGKRVSTDWDVDNSIQEQPFDNIMFEEVRNDYHLARFIYKAKTQYGFRVLANVSSNIDQNEFYDWYNAYHDTVTKRTSYPEIEELIANISDEFITRYSNLWYDHPEDVDYLEYGEDTLFLPLDSDGRISNIDKYVTDMYNLHVFEYRTRTGLVGNVRNNCSSIGVGDEACLNAFDAHLFEWEWWNVGGGSTGTSVATNPDTKLDELLALVKYSRVLGQLSQPCYPYSYLVQDRFDNTSWMSQYENYTEQQRANKVDSTADKIYLYSYHTNPCDCYWGNNSSALREFDHKISLLKNNNYGASNGSTIIVPTFNAKYYSSQLVSGTRPEYYGDPNRGCGNNTSNCDFCADLSGRALLNLTGTYPQKMGYVENIFQQQYDFDAVNTSPENSDNIIEGYCWYKSALLLSDSMNVVSAISDVEGESKSEIQIYPNPTQSSITVSSAGEIEDVSLYSLSGQLIYQSSNFQSGNEITLNQSGVYILQVRLKSGVVESKRVIKW